MARGVNKVILIGNCGQDPETKYLPSGNAVTNLNVATSDTWKDKQTGQQQERTEWHRVVFFNRLAEIAGEYLRKGSKVYIEGSLRTRKWQDQSGQDRYTTEIVANEMQMLDSRGAGMEAGQNPGMGMQNSGYGGGMDTGMGNPAMSGGGGNYGGGMGNSGYGGGNTGGASRPQQPQPAPPQSAPQPAPGFDNFDDDIPF